MIVARAWPDRPPAGRARVEDQFRRVPVDDYDYRRFAALRSDVIVLDWDTAVGLEDLAAFARRARAEPGRPLIGPCRMYAGLPEPVWNAKRYNPGGGSMRYVTEADASAHLFGFGMTYLPGALLAAFIAEHPRGRLDDISFSGWHHRTIAAETRIDWTVSPVHVHYDPPPGGVL